MKNYILIISENGKNIPRCDFGFGDSVAGESFRLFYSKKSNNYKTSVVYDNAFLTLVCSPSKANSENDSNISEDRIRDENILKKHSYGAFNYISYDIIKKSVRFYTDNIGSKPIFYSHHNDWTIISDNLYSIVRFLEDSGHNTSPDLQSIYLMLSYGYLFEDATLVNGIKKVPAATGIHIYGNNIDMKRYYVPSKSIIKRTFSDAESEFNELFRKAVTRQYDSDLLSEKGHLVTLSGGLDSRMNIIVARDLGYENFDAVTFAQSNSLDDIISRKIARDLCITHTVINLDNGKCLSDFENILDNNFGLVSVMGACHANYAFKSKSKFTNGFIHTGQLGDAIFGTYSFKSKDTILKDTGAGGEIRNYVANVIDKYEDLSEFYLWNRGFNGIMNGFWILRQFGEPVSPFLDPEIINFSFTLEKKLKKEQYLYLRWINRFYPQAARFKWSRWGLRPTLSNHAMFNRPIKRKIFWPVRQYNRKRLRKYPHMNPFQKWYDENEHIKQAILRDIEEYRFLLPQDKRLQAIINGILDSGNITDIMALLTVVLFMKRIS